MPARWGFAGDRPVCVATTIAWHGPFCVRNKHKRSHGPCAERKPVRSNEVLLVGGRADRDLVGTKQSRSGAAKLAPSDICVVAMRTVCCVSCVFTPLAADKTHNMT